MADSFGWMAHQYRPTDIDMYCGTIGWKVGRIGENCSLFIHDSVSVLASFICERREAFPPYLPSNEPACLQAHCLRVLRVYAGNRSAIINTATSVT